MTYGISTTDSAATQAVAAKLAPRLKGGEVIELASDLGGGKTTFTQGLMRALGYKDPVTSPTSLKRCGRCDPRVTSGCNPSPQEGPRRPMP